MQHCFSLPVLPPDNQLPVGCLRHLHFAVKDRILVAKLHQAPKPSHHRLLCALFNFLQRVIVAADIPVIPGPLHELIVIGPCEKSHIVNLGHAGGKKLDGTGQKVRRILLSHRRIIGDVDLVYLLFPVTASPVIPLKVSPVLLRLLNYPIQLLSGQEIRNVHCPKTVMRIQSGVLVSGTDGEPVPDSRRAFAVQCVEHHHREHKVIDRIAVGGDFELHGVVVVDFRQHRNPLLVQNALHPLHHIPHFRFQEKA